jgi:hypothetical protein
LCLRDLTKIVVGELMGQHTPKLLVVGLLKETGGDKELAPTGAGRIDVRVVHEANLDLTQGTRVIHGRDERAHDALDTFGLLRIERAGRGQSVASRRRLWLARWRATS